MKKQFYTLMQSPLFKAAFKFVAVVKYLFFPFLFVQSQDVNFQQLMGNRTITAQVETQTTVWLGTANGIYCINKKNQKIAHITETNSVLPSNQVTDMCMTTSGDIYATTTKGIFRFDGYTYMAYSNDNTNLPKTTFTSIAADKTGLLWIGTSDHGLVCMNGYRVQQFNTFNSPISSNAVESVASDNAGKIYAILSNKDMVVACEQSLRLIRSEWQIAVKQN